MWFLYLDESGDLGFDFKDKKPSKFFTVTILAVQGQDTNRQLINCVKKTLQRKLNQRGKRSRIVQELKGSRTTAEVKKYFYGLIQPLDFQLYTIVLNKTRVYDYLTERQSRVYNYVTRILLQKIPLEEASTRVQLTIDRSKTRPEITDFNAYVMKELESKVSPGIPLTITHENSCDSCGLQAVDMFSYGVFEGYERKRWAWFNTFKEKVAFSTVYLPDK